MSTLIRMIVEVSIACLLTFSLMILHELCHYAVAKKHNCRIIRTQFNKLTIESAPLDIERKIALAPYFVIPPISIALVALSFLLSWQVVGSIAFFITGIVMIVSHIISYFHEGRRDNEEKV